jgi:hypothetical protein
MVDFDTVGLTVLIADEDTRRHVEAVEREWTAGDGQLALARLRVAFDQLVESYAKWKERRPGLVDTKPAHSPIAATFALTASLPAAGGTGSRPAGAAAQPDGPPTTAYGAAATSWIR